MKTVCIMTTHHLATDIVFQVHTIFTYQTLAIQ